MNPTQSQNVVDLLPKDLSEEMLEELAIIAMEARDEDDDAPMPTKEAIEVAAFVQASVFELGSERPLPPKG